MDRLIYIAMTGAKHTVLQQATTTQNLSNSTTTGFRAQLDSFRALPVFGQGSPTRNYVVDSTTGTDFTPGVIEQTGRDLDVAIHGSGWIAVQGPDGAEAYTRSGSLQISPNGLLQTRNGLNVLGDTGPLSIPPDTEITVARDGTISTVPTGTGVNAVTTVGRIKLVNPASADLVRGDDGLFRMKSNTPAPADANVALASSSLESSNVNIAESLVSLISLARQFDMQIKMVQTADTNAQQSSQILNLNA
jgi:flagellar basal-body rod protein FlgF